MRWLHSVSATHGRALSIPPRSVIALGMNAKLRMIITNRRSILNNLTEPEESLQDILQINLKATNVSIVITIFITFSLFVGAGATSFYILNHGQIAFNYLSLLTVVNFCLGIYNIFALQRLKKQRAIIKLRLSYLKMRDSNSGGLLRNHRS